MKEMQKGTGNKHKKKEGEVRNKGCLQRRSRHCCETQGKLYLSGAKKNKDKPGGGSLIR